MELSTFFSWFVKLNSNHINVIKGIDIFDGIIEAVNVLSGHFGVKDMNLLEN